MIDSKNNGASQSNGYPISDTISELLHKVTHGYMNESMQYNSSFTLVTSRALCHATHSSYTFTRKDINTESPPYTYTEKLEFAMPKVKVKRHRHDYFELMIVLEGELDMMIEKGTYHYKKGDACLLNRNTLHAEIFGTDFLIAYLSFYPEYIKDWPENGTNEPLTGTIRDFLMVNIQDKKGYKKEYINFTSVEQESTAINLIIGGLENELRLKKPGYLLMVRGYVYRMFDRLQDTNLYRAAYINLDSTAETDLFEKIVRYIEKRKEKVTRHELAEVFNYNGNYINDVVKKHTGLSIRQYCLNIYLEETCRLLEQTDLSIVQISKQVGFVNRTQFYTVFKERFGMTPQAYRDQYHTPPE